MTYRIGQRVVFANQRGRIDRLSSFRGRATVRFVLDTGGAVTVFADDNRLIYDITPTDFFDTTPFEMEPA